MNKKHIKSLIIGGLASTLFMGTAFAQDADVPAVVSDTIAKNKKENEVRTDMTTDRNVMLNANSSSGPRSLNIGLPASSVGIDIIENGLPVSYAIYPILPIKVWRLDTGILGFKLNNMGTSAIETGIVGYTASVNDNFGIPLTKRIVSLKANHYGLLNGSATWAGELNNKLTMYSVTAGANLDPGTYKANIGKYYGDKTFFFKGALSQAYKNDNILGRVGVQYRYFQSGGALGGSLPMIYNKDGSVSQYKDLEIGKTSFYENSGNMQVKDPFTGQVKEHRYLDEEFKIHTVDVMNDMRFRNGLKSNTTFRVMTGKGGGATSLPVSRVATAPGQYQYMDETPYTQSNAYMAITPWISPTSVTYLAGVTSLSNTWKNHKWKAALTGQYYRLKDFTMSSTIYYLEMADNPKKVVSTSPGLFDQYGNLQLGYNSIMEYVSGSETKAAAYITDSWQVTDRISLDLGVRLEMHHVDADYAPTEARSGGLFDRSKFANHTETFLNKAFNVSGVWKATNSFGFLADGGLNEKAPGIINYSNGEDLGYDVAQIWNGGLGIYYNHNFFNIVSKGTYISRSNYITNETFQPPHNLTLQRKKSVTYDIETLGWTTDVLVKPVNGLELHALFTIQNPQYKNYSGTVDFSDGSVYAYTYTDKVVAEISRYLLELDGSYNYKNHVKLSLNARYFSKTYANKSNFLTFAPRWETFATITYIPKTIKGMELGVTFVNLLNDKGASGSVASADMLGKDEVQRQMVGNVFAGSYMRPFTTEFTVRYIF